MLDVTDSVKEYKVGDIVELRLGYFSVLRAFTSPYVERYFLKMKKSGAGQGASSAEKHVCFSHETVADF